MKHLGIITPLIPEAKCFIDSPVRKQPVQITDKISLIVSGQGCERARESVITLLESGVDGLLVMGMAGALDPELSPGDLVIPDIIVTEDNQIYRCHNEWAKILRDQIELGERQIVNYPIFTSKDVLSQSTDKIRVNKQFNTCAVDMESAAVVALANEHQLPCLVARAIIDPVDFTFPEYLLALTDEYGEVPVIRLLLAVVRHPLQIYRLMQLIKYYSLASDTLKKTAKNPENLVAFPH